MTDISSENKPLLFHPEHGSYGGDNLDSEVCLSPTESDLSLEIAERKVARNKLLIACCICLLFMIGEVLGGYFSGSLAIMTDAAHMLSDFASMLISLFAIWISGKAATTKMSFGYHRAEILGAMISVLMIWLLTGILVYEAILRVMDPQAIDGKIMFITASAGFGANIFMACALGHGHSHGGGGDHGHSHGGGDHGHSHGDHGHGDSEDDHDLSDPTEEEKKAHKKAVNINVRAAYIHVLGDLIQSLGVMIASIIVWVQPTWTIVDPICTFIFSILVLFTTFSIVGDGMHVLMEGVPKGINRDAIMHDLEAIEGVDHAHDMHIWSITIGKPALAVHLTLTPSGLPDAVLLKAQRITCKRYGIHHSTIQLESSATDFHCESGGQCNKVCDE